MMTPFAVATPRGFIGLFIYYYYFLARQTSQLGRYTYVDNYKHATATYTYVRVYTCMYMVYAHIQRKITTPHCTDI